MLCSNYFKLTVLHISKSLNILCNITDMQYVITSWLPNLIQPSNCHQMALTPILVVHGVCPAASDLLPESSTPWASEGNIMVIHLLWRNQTRLAMQMQKTNCWNIMHAQRLGVVLILVTTSFCNSYYHCSVFTNF